MLSSNFTLEHRINGLACVAGGIVCVCESVGSEAINR